MKHSSKEQETLEAIAKDVRSLRYSFGISLIIIAILLMVTLPQVIENTIYRTDRMEPGGSIESLAHGQSKAATSTSTATTSTASASKSP